jgi:hypothetical protein
VKVQAAAVAQEAERERAAKQYEQNSKPMVRTPRAYRALFLSAQLKRLRCNSLKGLRVSY